MRDVVIIGGGLSGLAAAYELEKLAIPYTLIEVKRRLGGSIASEQHNGFTLDAGPMLANEHPEAPFITAFGLTDMLYIARIDKHGAWIAFKDGMGTLIDTLAKPLLSDKTHGLVMARMAVSTIGRMDDHYFVCMENGMVLDAKAIIVAAPARYAERIFHTLKTEISFRLLDYPYESIARVSLGYQHDEIQSIDYPAESPITYVYQTDLLRRVPAHHLLLQVGVHFDPSQGIPPTLARDVTKWMGWNAAPTVERITAWSESDPIAWRNPAHSANIDAIRALLPDGIALAGSDYVAANRPPTLQDRITQGQDAARRVAKWLTG
jgi:protoporphyrinogen oxidase